MNNQDKLSQLKEAFDNYQKALHDLFSGLHKIERDMRPVLDEIVRCWPILLEHDNEMEFELNLGKLGGRSVEATFRIEWQDDKKENRRLVVDNFYVDNKTFCFYPAYAEEFELACAEQGCKESVKDLIALVAGADKIIDMLTKRLNKYAKEMTVNPHE